MRIFRNFDIVIKTLSTMIDYFAANLWAIWASIAIICLIIELGSGDFFVTCFAIGAISAMLVSFFPAPLWLQVLFLIVCSVLSLIFIRPTLVRKMHNKSERLSNSDALIGREGKVIEAIAPGEYGYVKVDGDEWKSYSDDASTIEIGETVKIIGRESIIVHVERV